MRQNYPENTRFIYFQDPYENIYSVIRGSKTFTVFPPTEAWCMEGITFQLVTTEFFPSLMYYCRAHLPTRELPPFWKRYSTRAHSFGTRCPSRPMVLYPRPYRCRLSPSGGTSYQYRCEGRGVSLSPCGLVALCAANGGDHRGQLLV